MTKKAKRAKPTKANKAKPVMGRPRKLTLKMQTEICAWIGDGNTFEDACAASGIASASARLWMRDGARALDRQEGGEILSDVELALAAFVSAVRLAQGKPKATAVRNLMKAGGKDWRAALAYLERRFPREYGLHVNVNVAKELDAFLDRLESRLSPEQFAEVLRAADGEASSG